MEAAKWEYKHTSRYSCYYTVNVEERLRTEGYQKPPKAFSFSYLGLKHPSSSSSLTPRHSTTLTDTRGDLLGSHRLITVNITLHTWNSTALGALPDVMSMLCRSSSSLLIFSSSSFCTVSKSNSFSLCTNTQTNS